MANALRALPTLGLLVLLFLIISPVVSGQARLRAAHHHRACPACGSADTHRNVRRHSDRRPGRGRCGPRNGLHQAPDPASGATSVRVAADDLRCQKLDPADRFDGDHRRLSRSAGSRPVHLDGRAQANFAEMVGGAILVAVLALVLEFSFAGSAGSSCRRDCAASQRNPAHPSPRPSPSRPPPRCRTAPIITSGEHHEEAHDPLGPGRHARYLRCPRVAAAAAIRSRATGTTPDPRVRRSSSVPPTSPKAS